MGMTFLWIMRKNSIKNHKAEHKLQKTIESKKTDAYALYPKIDPKKCLACGLCTKVCPEGDILQMVNSFPVLVNPTKCVGHSLCYRSCPYDAITMVFGSKDNSKQLPS